jgi:hypothetical protein
MIIDYISNEEKKITTQVQCTPLNGIALGQTTIDPNNGTILISE